MSAQCSHCRQQPAVTPDGRCAACGAGQPTQGMPQAPPPAPPYGQAGPYAPPPQGGGPYAPPPQAGGGNAGGRPAYWSSPQGLCTALTVLFIGCAVVWFVGVVADIRMSSLLTDIEDGRHVSREDAEAADDFYAATGVLQGLMGLATGIVFLVWFHRVRVNAELFDPARHRKKRGWAIGGWFVPVVNFWFPKQITNDIWWASAPREDRRGLAVVSWWWGLWVAMSVTSIAAFQADAGELDRQELLDDIQREVHMTGLSDMLGVAAAILALLFVRRLTQRQLTKYAEGPDQPVPFGAGAPGGPAPHQPYPGQPNPGQAFPGQPGQPGPGPQGGPAPYPGAPGGAPFGPPPGS